ncbi:hypothetical protein SKAU_G00252010 [Synaphobranchus kaupii]|uniref:Uncharacterized protein n=1 Tax=Synaphobranchus kaupii TaxID=118154 RepID=A0A9Q1F360_SYNKA|nr:hypothetical protein SKAU_G00252010 [Synaphobranchus kaupii]
MTHGTERSARVGRKHRWAAPPAVTQPQAEAIHRLRGNKRPNRPGYAADIFISAAATPPRRAGHRATANAQATHKLPQQESKERTLLGDNRTFRYVLCLPPPVDK